MVCRRGMADYEVQIPHKGICLFQVNLLKDWNPHEEPVRHGAEPDRFEEGEQHTYEQEKQLQKQLQEG